MNNKLYTYDEALTEFTKSVGDFKNQTSRVPARANSPKDVEAYATKVYNEKFKDALHPSVLDQYKS